MNIRLFFVLELDYASSAVQVTSVVSLNFRSNFFGVPDTMTNPIPDLLDHQNACTTNAWCPPHSCLRSQFSVPAFPCSVTRPVSIIHACCSCKRAVSNQHGTGFLSGLF